MILKDGKIGQSYRICEISLPEKITRRLEMLGMTKSTLISVLNRKGSGTMIIRVRGTRFALSGAYTSGITVDEA